MVLRGEREEVVEERRAAQLGELLDRDRRRHGVTL
jgi:hypothetical protein